MMEHRIETVVGPAAWRSDEQGFAVTFRGRTARALWEEVTAGGFVESAMSLEGTDTSPRFFADFSKYLPGVGKLAQINEHLAGKYRTLVLARGRSDRATVRLPLPLDDPATGEIVDEVRSALGRRWRGEIPLSDSYANLGIARPWWTIPLTILVILALGFILLFACTGFAALGRVLEGEPLDIPAIAWAGMALWLMLIGAILWLYRRMWRR